MMYTKDRLEDLKNLLYDSFSNDETIDSSLYDIIKDMEEGSIKSLIDRVPDIKNDVLDYLKGKLSGKGKFELVRIIMKSCPSQKKHRKLDYGKKVDMKKRVTEAVDKVWNKFAEEDEIPVLEKIIEFFKNNPEPEDDEVHAFADEEGIDPHELEQEIYKLLGAFIGRGKSNLPENKDRDFDDDQEEKGVEVEQEHIEGADLPKEILDILAQKITNDHQSESEPDGSFDDEYYDYLSELEDSLKKEDKGHKNKEEDDEEESDEDDD